MSKTARGRKVRLSILAAVLLAAVLTGRDGALGPPVAKAGVNARSPAKAQPPSTEVGPELPVSDPVYVNAATSQSNAQVAFDGTNYLVVWQDDRNRELRRRLCGTRHPGRHEPGPTRDPDRREGSPGGSGAGRGVRRDELPRHVGPGRLSDRRPLRRAGQPGRVRCSTGRLPDRVRARRPKLGRHRLRRHELPRDVDELPRGALAVTSSRPG